MPAKTVTPPQSAPQPDPQPAAQPAPLPGARHGRDPERAIKRGPSRVPPEQVAATQRDRLFDGLVHTVAEHGYADAAVTDICRAAGVTRPAFYVLFDGKQDAFLATYRHGTDVVFRMMEHAYEQQEGWREGTLAGLRVLLDVLASVPAFARMAIVEIEAVGPAAWEQRAHFLRRFGRFFDDAPAPLGLADPQLAAPLVDMLVGGVYSAIYRHVAAGRAAQLPELLPALAHFLLVPFLGPQSAGTELSGPRRGPAPGESLERAIAPCLPQAAKIDEEGP